MYFPKYLMARSIKINLSGGKHLYKFQQLLKVELESTQILSRITVVKDGQSQRCLFDGLCNDVLHLTVFLSVLAIQVISECRITL